MNPAGTLWMEKGEPKGFNIGEQGTPPRSGITESRREFLHEYSGETGSVTGVFYMENPELFSGTVHEPG
jgi:hypothetical protein